MYICVVIGFDTEKDNKYIKTKQMAATGNKTITNRLTKTVDLDKDTLRAFRAYVKGFRYMVECVEDCGLNVRTIKETIKNGTCHPTTAQRINQLLETQKVA